jgi:hypothetical protein
MNKQKYVHKNPDIQIQISRVSIPVFKLSQRRPDNQFP